MSSMLPYQFLCPTLVNDPCPEKVCCEPKDPCNEFALPINFNTEACEVTSTQLADCVFQFDINQVLASDCLTVSYCAIPQEDLLDGFLPVSTGWTDLGDYKYCDPSGQLYILTVPGQVEINEIYQLKFSITEQTQGTLTIHNGAQTYEVSANGTYVWTFAIDAPFIYVTFEDFDGCISFHNWTRIGDVDVNPLNAGNNEVINIDRTFNDCAINYTFQIKADTEPTEDFKIQFTDANDDLYESKPLRCVNACDSFLVRYNDERTCLGFPSGEKCGRICGVLHRPQWITSAESFSLNGCSQDYYSTQRKVYEFVIDEAPEYFHDWINTMLLHNEIQMDDKTYYIQKGSYVPIYNDYDNNAEAIIRLEEKRPKVCGCNVDCICDNPVLGPEANFVFTQNGTGTESIFTFNAASSVPSIYCNIAMYTWDFGDGNTGTGQVVNHSYASAGIYNVVLTVTDCNGRTDTYQGAVSV